jgi:hypothetical protein
VDDSRTAGSRGSLHISPSRHCKPSRGMNATLNERSENNLSIRIVASYCLACEPKSYRVSHVRYAHGVYPPTPILVCFFVSVPFAKWAIGNIIVFDRETYHRARRWLASVSACLPPWSQAAIRSSRFADKTRSRHAIPRTPLGLWPWKVGAWGGTCSRCNNGMKQGAQPSASPSAPSHPCRFLLLEAYRALI